MSYIYHQKPSSMQGTILYPLNELREKYPVIFEEEAKKYDGREGLMQQWIPRLECLWSDVLFTLPINPALVFREMINAGLQPNPAREWYKISIRDIKDRAMVWYSYPDRGKGDFSILHEDVALLNAQAYKELASVPQDTIDYYKRVFKNGEQPFLFHLIPHVLIKGSIDISDSETISWASA
jgi:hypothetical protein